MQAEVTEQEERNTGEDFGLLGTLRLPPGTALPQSTRLPAGALPTRGVGTRSTDGPSHHQQRQGSQASPARLPLLHGTTPHTSAEHLRDKQGASTEQEHCCEQTSPGSEATTTHVCHLTQLGPHFYQA